MTIYDVARAKDSNYIVMEWVNGKPLSEKIEEKLEPFYTQISGLRRSPQFLCRTIIIKRILELTDTYTHKINSLIAINRDEMKNITGGRAVLNKYHHTPE